MRRALFLLLVLGGALVGLVAAGNAGFGPVVITSEAEQKIILTFGARVRDVTEPGLSFYLPVVETLETYDRRWLYLDTEAVPIQTKDGEQLNVDNYIVWRIANPVAFRRSFPGGMVDAEARIDRAVRDDVREVIGRHTLEDVLTDLRTEIMDEIAEKSREALAQFGLQVSDVRIKRTELPEQTEESVYARMRTERQRLAREKRAEGDEQARRIRAESDREARVIVAEAKRDAEIAHGTGEAAATRIYAEAYGGDAEFYELMRSLEAYRKAIDEKTTIVTSPNNEFFRFLEGTSPPASSAEDR